MNLFKYESKKVLNNRSFHFMWFLLLIFHLCVILLEEPDMWLNSKMYQSIYSVIAELEPQEALNTLAIWKETDKHLYDADMIDEVLNEISIVYDRDQMIFRTIENAQRNLKIPFLSENQQNSSTENVKKTLHDYENAKLFKINRFEPEKGIRLILEMEYVDILLIILISYAIYLMMGQGFGNGTEKILFCYENGKGRLLFVRVLVLLCLSGTIVLSFIVSRILIAYILYGLGGLDRPLQMISTYIKCIVTVSVREMLFYQWVWKWIWLFIISLVILISFKCCRVKIFPIVLITVLWVVGKICTQTIAENSFFRPIKYLNFYYIMQANEVFGQYNNIQLFNKPISMSLIALSVTVISICVFVLLLYCLKNKMYIEKERKKHKGWWKNKSFYGLFTGELYKLFLVMNVAVLLLGGIAFQIYAFQNRHIQIGNERRIYRSYVNQWERKILEEDEELEKQMEKEFEELNLALQGKSNIYSSSQAKEFRKELENVRQRYEELVRKVNESGEGLVLFFEDEFNLLINDRENDMKNALIITLLTVVITACYVGYEQSSGMRVMIKATGIGEKCYYKNKTFILGLICAFLVMLIYVPDILLVLKTYGGEHFSIPIHSIKPYENYVFGINVGEYLFLLYFVRWMGSCLISMGVLIVTERLKSTMFSIFLNTAIYGFPYYLYYATGLKITIGFSALITGNGYMQ